MINLLSGQKNQVTELYKMRIINECFIISSLVMIMKIISCIAALLAVASSYSDDAPIVKTSLGEVQGSWATSFDGRQYAAYEGIPYAEKPIGDLRFEEPKPAKKWSGVLVANTMYKCPQTSFTLDVPPFGEEDCLYLNIYVPKVSSGRKLDVVFHIHGGAFVEGYGSEYTGAKYLMDRDIIFVTFQYRLGALGFLSTDDEVVPGNMGLKDQFLALKWVKNNIENFGGNSESITLTGLSSGALSGHLFFLNPAAKGLFHKAMLTSGTSLTSTLQYNALEKAKALGKYFDCSTETSKQLIACLKTKSAAAIINATVQTQYPYPPLPSLAFSPLIEKAGSNPFLSEHPYKLMQKKQVLDVPMITSSASHDGYFISLFAQDRLPDLNANWTEKSKYLLYTEYTAPKENATEIAKTIRKYYFGDKDIDASTYETLTRLTTDRFVRIDGQLTAQLQAKITKSSVYYYIFSYDSVNSFRNNFPTRYSGACHGDDMVYFFGGGILISTNFTESDIRMKNIALDTLYSFAHTGVPVLGGKATWRPIGGKFEYLDIGGPDDLKMITKTDFTTDKMWQGLGLRENTNL